MLILTISTQKYVEEKKIEFGNHVANSFERIVTCGRKGSKSIRKLGLNDNVIKVREVRSYKESKEL